MESPFDVQELAERILCMCQNPFLREVCKKWERILSNPAMWKNFKYLVFCLESCRVGQYDSVMWLSTTFKINSNQIRSLNNYAIRHACKNGHIDVVRYLVLNFNFTKKDIIDHAREILLELCMRGKLEEIQQIIYIFGLTAGDIKNNVPEIIKLLILNGNFLVLRFLGWIIRQFDDIIRFMIL